MNLLELSTALNNSSKSIHEFNRSMGWWKNLKYQAQLDKIITKFNVTPQLAEEILASLDITEEADRPIPALLMLVVSEVAEAMEGDRKKLMDDKLPHRSMFEVELADVIIRILDIAGKHNLDLGGAVLEKVQYNATREDHKPENRLQEGGKAY